MQFYRLAPGARFEFNGRQYIKLAMSMARDPDRVGTIFTGDTEVEPVGEPLLLSESEAAKWKPSETPWYEHMSRAPRQS